MAGFMARKGEIRNPESLISADKNYKYYCTIGVCQYVHHTQHKQRRYSKKKWNESIDDVSMWETNPSLDTVMPTVQVSP